MAYGKVFASENRHQGSVADVLRHSLWIFKERERKIVQNRQTMSEGRWKVTKLREIDTQAQRRWEEEHVFEVDAPSG